MFSKIKNTTVEQLGGKYCFKRVMKQASQFDSLFLHFLGEIKSWANKP